MERILASTESSDWNVLLNLVYYVMVSLSGWQTHSVDICRKKNSGKTDGWKDGRDLDDLYVTW